MLLLVLSIFVDPNCRFFTIKNEHFTIIYPEEYDSVASRFSEMSEEVYQEMCEFYGKKNLPCATVVLFDNIDMPEGYSYNFPRNTIKIFLKKGEIFDFNNHDDWLKIVFIHEYTHIIEGDRNRGFPFNILKWIFGNAYHSYDYLPIGFVEGFAVYSESKNSGYGRINSPLYNAILKCISPPSLIEFLSGEFREWPFDLTPYIVGSAFFHFIDSLYGEETAKRIGMELSDYPLFVTHIFHRYTGRWLGELWKEFKATFRDKPEVKGERITFDGGYKKYLIGDEQHIVYSSMLSGNSMPFFAIDNKRYKYYPSGKGSLRNGILYQPVYIMEDGWYLFSYVLKMDLKTGKREILKKYKRIKRITVDSEGCIIYASDKEIIKDDSLILKLEYGNVEDIAISPSDTLLAYSLSLGVFSGIYTYNLKTGEIKEIIINRDVNVEPSFSDGDSLLLFTSGNKNGYKIYCFSLLDDKIYYIVDGFSAFLRGDTLFYLSFNNKGVDVYRVKFGTGRPAGMQNETHIPERIEEDVLNVESKSSYNPLVYLLPTGWMPYIQPAWGGPFIGGSISSIDPLNYLNYSISYTYKLENHYADWSFISFKLSYNRWVKPSFFGMCDIYFPGMFMNLNGGLVLPFLGIYSYSHLTMQVSRIYYPGYLNIGSSGISYGYSSEKNYNSLISPVGFTFNISGGFVQGLTPCLSFDIEYKRNIWDIVLATRFSTGLSVFSDYLYETRNIEPLILRPDYGLFLSRVMFTGEMRFPIIKKPFGFYPVICRDISGVLFYDEIIGLDSPFIYYYIPGILSGFIKGVFPSYYGFEINFNIGLLNHFDQRIRIGWAHARISNKDYLYVARNWSF